MHQLLSITCVAVFNQKVHAKDLWTPFPDIASCDIFLFLQIKNIFSKGKQFEDVEMIRFNTTQQLLEIPKVYYEGCVQ